MKILFVCSGNTCRSPMAEHIFRDLLKEKGLDEKVSVSSGGMYKRQGDRMAATAQEVLSILWGIDGSKHRSKELDRALLLEQDMILTMTAKQAEYLKNEMPEAAASISTFMGAVLEAQKTLDRLHAADGQQDDSVYANLNHGDIVDPYGQSYEVYEATARLLREYLSILANYIATQVEQ